MLQLLVALCALSAVMARTRPYPFNCYDFQNYATGTKIDAYYIEAGTQPFAGGNVLINVNVEARNKNTMVVIRGGERPYAYKSDEGLANACLFHDDGSPNAGIALFNPRNESKWYQDGGFDFRRKAQSAALEAISFSFLASHSFPVTYFSVVFSDLGDWNPLDVDPTSASVILTAFGGGDSGGVQIDRDSHNIPNLVPGNDYDACDVQNELIVFEDSDDSTPPINSCVVTFSSIKDSQVVTLLFDPNMAIIEVCFPGAQGKNDPHFTGFDGSSYDFKGSPGAVFNLITDTNFQLNTMLIKSPVDGKTYMGALGLRVGANRLYVDPQRVSLNGEILSEGDYALPEGDANAGVVFVSTDSVSIHTDGYNLEVSTVHWKRNMTHLNFQSSVNSRFITDPHGILGQTAQYLVKGEKANPRRIGTFNENALGFLEGRAEDYIVADGIFGVRTTFNRFGTSAKRNENAIKKHAAGGAVYKIPSE